MYYIGTVIFIALAVLCVVAFMKVKKRDDEYGRGEWTVPGGGDRRRWATGAGRRAANYPACLESGSRHRRVGGPPRGAGSPAG